MNVKYQRIVSLLKNNLVHFKSIGKVAGNVSIRDVTGPFFRLIYTEDIEGKVYWLRDNKKVEPQKRQYALFIPPYSISEDVHENSYFKCEMLLGDIDLNTKFNEPIIFYPDKFQIPLGIEEIKNILDNIVKYDFIGRAINPNVIASKAKIIIQNNFLDNIKIDTVAKKLSISNAMLSQYFKKSFGMTPVQYRRALRIEYSILLLSQGKAPAEVAHKVGYNDLGRFYKQFKDVLYDCPGNIKNK